jgi:hypothetical protein
MRSRYVGGLTLIVGILLLLTPLYWDTLLNIGVSPALDPAAAIGAAPGGGYPAAVGATALAVGSAVVWLAESDNQQPTTIVLAGGIGGALIGILATTVLVSVPLFLATQIGLAGAAPGFAAVRGAATEQTSQRLGTGLVVLSLAPFAGAHIIRGTTIGGMAGFASFILAGTLIVYTAILSYPFYRLGRAVQ